jgi:spermidine/putrescine transport system substrate-binding protein
VSGLNRSSARKTVGAARRFRRRTFLALGGAAVAAAAGGIGIIGGRSSRELSLLNRPDALPDLVISNFEKTTGIKVKSTSFSQNDDQMACPGRHGRRPLPPMRDRAPQFRDLGLLGAFDASRVPNAQLIPSLLRDRPASGRGRRAPSSAALLGHRGHWWRSDRRRRLRA